MGGFESCNDTGVLRSASGWRLCKWCRGTESNCRHQPFQDVVALCNELKLRMSFCRSERGQPNGPPAIFKLNVRGARTIGHVAHLRSDR